MVFFEQDSQNEITSRLFDLKDRGLLLGDGVFDTFRIANHKVVLKDHHITRLLGSCKAIGIEVDKVKIISMYDQVGRSIKDGGGRVTITRGPTERGIQVDTATSPTFIAQSFEVAPPFPQKTISVCISDIRRNETSPSSRYKTLAYMDNIAAQMRASERGFDDAMHLNSRGLVTCATKANLFVVSKTGCVLTPPLADGVIAGVIRDVILDNREKLDMEIVEKSLSLADLRNAKSLFMTNSLRMVQSVSRVEDIHYDTFVPDRILSLLKGYL